MKTYDYKVILINHDGCNDCYNCSDCIDCWDCSGCNDCNNCSNGINCSDCEGLYNFINKKNWSAQPSIDTTNEKRPILDINDRNLDPFL
jgi:hypothetical protein